MTSRRIAKISQAIRETVSSTILFGLKDPRVKNVTVIDVEVSGDTRNAKVFVSVLGDAKTQALSLYGLNSARGFIQKRVADRIQTRYTPILRFVLDQSVKRSIEASRVIREIEPPSADGDPAVDDEPGAEVLGETRVDEPAGGNDEPGKEPVNESIDPVEESRE